MPSSQNNVSAPPSRAAVFIGRWFGIRFYLDYSWFLIAAMVVYTLATAAFPVLLKDASSMTCLLAALAAAFLYFLSILLHELGHSLVSRRCGIPVPSITLLFIGGIAEISREPDDPVSELKIAIAGPAVSAILAILYTLLALAFDALDYAPGEAVFQWLAFVNVLLILFNAIPGYPLDGGRVLRAILWKRSGNMRKATYIASRIGIGFAWLLMGLGVFALFDRQWSAFVLLLIGMFLKTAAESGYLHAFHQEILAGVSVRQIMTPKPITIPETLPLNLAVDDYFLTNHHIAFPVCGDRGEFRGLLRLERLKELPREKWPYTTAGDFAGGPDLAAIISPDDTAAGAMRRFSVYPIESRLAVIEEERLVGILTPHDILKFIQIHSELEA